MCEVHVYMYAVRNGVDERSYANIHTNLLRICVYVRRAGLCTTYGERTVCASTDVWSNGRMYEIRTYHTRIEGPVTLRPNPKKNMVYCTGPYAGVDYNLTLCPLQNRLQHIYHGQPYAKVDLNPMPESTLASIRALDLDSGSQIRLINI